MRIYLIVLGLMLFFQFSDTMNSFGYSKGTIFLLYLLAVLLAVALESIYRRMK